jgi:hypothetical protein
MVSNNYFTRLHRRLSPALLSATFMLVNVAVVAASFQYMMPMSEKWG